METQVQPLFSQRWRMNSELVRGPAFAFKPSRACGVSVVEGMPSFLVQSNLQMRPEKRLVPVYSAV